MKAVIIEASCFMSMDGMDIHIDKDNLEKASNLSKKGYYTVLACGKPKNGNDCYIDAFKYAKALFDMKTCKVNKEVIERTSNDNLFTYPNTGMFELVLMQASRDGINSMSDITFIGCDDLHAQAAKNAGCSYKDINSLEP